MYSIIQPLKVYRFRARYAASIGFGAAVESHSSNRSNCMDASCRQESSYAARSLGDNRAKHVSGILPAASNHFRMVSTLILVDGDLVDSRARANASGFGLLVFGGIFTQQCLLFRLVQSVPCFEDELAAVLANLDELFALLGIQIVL